MGSLQALLGGIPATSKFRCLRWMSSTRSSLTSCRETTKLDALRAATERTIALLKERRAALIAAAVTGQIEVEGAA